MFYCLNVQLYHLWGKSRFVCAHIGQNRDIYPPSIFRLHFWLVPPPPIPQVHRGGCYREKFFSFLFSRFSHSISTRILFFYFFWFSFGFFDIRFSVKLVYIRSILSRLRFLTSLLNFDSFFLVSISTCFGIADSTLQLFISSTLLLIINKHLCLYEFVLCLFWLF